MHITGAIVALMVEKALSPSAPVNALSMKRGNYDLPGFVPERRAPSTLRYCAMGARASWRI